MKIETLDAKERWKLAHTMDVKAICRLYDDATSWEIYILAQNPQNPDEVICIESADYLQLRIMSLNEIDHLFNFWGREPIYDKEFIPRSAKVIWDELTKRQEIYEYGSRTRTKTKTNFGDDQAFENAYDDHPRKDGSIDRGIGNDN